MCNRSSAERVALNCLHKQAVVSTVPGPFGPGQAVREVTCRPWSAAHLRSPFSAPSLRRSRIHSATSRIRTTSSYHSKSSTMCRALSGSNLREGRQVGQFSRHRRQRRVPYRRRAGQRGSREGAGVPRLTGRWTSSWPATRRVGCTWPARGGRETSTDVWRCHPHQRQRRRACL